MSRPLKSTDPVVARAGAAVHRSAAPQVEPIKRRKLGQELLERLLQRIHGGEWKPGDRLPSERDLMAAYGVGRPAVREALQSVERMGLIAITHGGGARLVALTADSILQQVGEAARRILETSPGTLEHLKQARLVFEVAIVRIAAALASDEQVAALRLRLAEHRAAIRDGSRFLECDLAFHREIAAMTGNPIFEAISGSTFEWLKRFHVEQVRVPGAERLTIAEHGRIVKAISARDPDAAARAMTEHLTRANRLYAVLEKRAP